jgi:hypothetical protein
VCRPNSYPGEPNFFPVPDFSNMGPGQKQGLPTVWGFAEGFSDLRDIGLKPIRLKDKASVFCGIDINKNKIEFYVPVLRIDRNKFLLSTTVLNNNEAVLTVLTDLSTIKFYLINRPG